MEPPSPQPEPSHTAPIDGEAIAAQAIPSGLLRIAWIFAGAIVPTISFGVTLYPFSYSNGSSCYPFGLPTGSFSSYAECLLAMDNSMPLVPLLLICMGSIFLLALRPGYVESGWIRLGIFSGIILSLEYWFLFQIALRGAHGCVVGPGRSHYVGHVRINRRGRTSLVRCTHGRISVQAPRNCRLSFGADHNNHRPAFDRRAD